MFIVLQYTVVKLENLQSSVAGLKDGEVNCRAADSVFITKPKQGSGSTIKSHSY